ncbi:unnamed protein product [Schistosoma turkestanicum]|nr:unnamed protein product [Schistosoma turkestanicum]
MTDQHPMYIIKKLGHIPSELRTSSYKASDGSLCFCTVIDFNQGRESGLPLECCSFCLLDNNIQHSPVVLNSNSRFRILLGNAPDTTQYGNQQTLGQLSLRSLIEKILFNCASGDVFNVEIGSVENSEKHKNPSTFNLSLRVDYVLVPPICGHSTTTATTTTNSNNTELMQSDPRENTTMDWNPHLTIQWLYRSWYLKERGSWLVNHHLKYLTPASSSDNSNDRNKLFQYIWSSAFACYSRALQLVTLAYWAEKTCMHNDDNDADADADAYVDNDDVDADGDGDALPSIKKTDENHSNCCANNKITTHNNIHWIQIVSGEKKCITIMRNNENLLTSSDDYIDWDCFGSIDYKTIIPLQFQSLRLMFTLLSNIALCQLKIGSNDYCARNCSHALYLLSCQLPNSFTNNHHSSTNTTTTASSDDYYHQDIINAKLFSQDKLQYYAMHFQITYYDIHKLLFRRAQAYFNQGKMDEARNDLIICNELMTNQLIRLQNTTTTTTYNNNSSIDSNNNNNNDNNSNNSNNESQENNNQKPLTMENNDDHYKQMKAALQASKNLLIKVNDRLTQDEAVLLARLRRRTQQIE